jgi:Smg protein
MYDVLVFVYENYWQPEACPEPKLLARKLAAVGFEREEIQEALHWLQGLGSRTHDGARAGDLGQQASSDRHYSPSEVLALGQAGIGFIRFLEDAKVLKPALRELVIERALATGVTDIELEDLKVIVLMVFWSAGEEPDALILDELFVAPEERELH